MRFIAIALVLTACTTLQDRVNDELQVGDDFPHVKEVLGRPSNVVKLGGGLHGVEYRSNEHTCRLLFDTGSLVMRECERNDGYAPPWAVALTSMGKALSHARDDEMECVEHTDHTLTCSRAETTYDNCTRNGNTVQCR